MIATNDDVNSYEDSPQDGDDNIFCHHHDEFFIDDIRYMYTRRVDKRDDSVIHTRTDTITKTSTEYTQCSFDRTRKNVILYMIGYTGSLTLIEILATQCYVDASLKAENKEPFFSHDWNITIDNDYPLFIPATLKKMFPLGHSLSRALRIEHNVIDGRKTIVYIYNRERSIVPNSSCGCTGDCLNSSSILGDNVHYPCILGCVPPKVISYIKEAITILLKNRSIYNYIILQHVARLITEQARNNPATIYDKRKDKEESKLTIIIKSEPSDTERNYYQEQATDKPNNNDVVFSFSSRVEAILISYGLKSPLSMSSL